MLASQLTHTPKLNKRRKKMAIRILALVAALGLSACATVEGIGKDVESGGEAIQDASNEVKKAL